MASSGKHPLKNLEDCRGVDSSNNVTRGAAFTSTQKGILNNSSANGSLRLTSQQSKGGYREATLSQNLASTLNRSQGLGRVPAYAVTT
jgi:hypothetical protein